MRKSFRRPTLKPTIIHYRVNRSISAPELRLIDENGANVGVVSTVEALRMAETADLDLVEVSPLAKPPVAKILDFNQFKYQHEKEVQKAKVKQKKQETKGIRLSFRISSHDIELRVNQAIKFLEDNHKIRIELLLRGREHQHKDKAAEVIDQFIVKLREKFIISIEQPLQRQGGKLSLICFTTGKVSSKKDKDAEEEINSTNNN